MKSNEKYIDTIFEAIRTQGWNYETARSYLHKKKIDLTTSQIRKLFETKVMDTYHKFNNNVTKTAKELGIREYIVCNIRNEFEAKNKQVIKSIDDALKDN